MRRCSGASAVVRPRLVSTPETMDGLSTKAAVLALFLGVSLCLQQVSLGDSITISNPTAVASTVDLTAGTNDWAHYAISNDTTSNGSVGMVFDHPSATHFSSLSGVDGMLNGFDVMTEAPLLTWTGGTPDATGSSHSWVFNTNNSASDAGLSFTYSMAPGQTILNLYVNAYTDAILTPLPVELQARLASGANAQNTANLPVFWDGSTEQDGDYAIDVVNTTAAAETLTVTYAQTVSQNGPTNNGSNPGIFGVTATTVVPEPASLGLLLSGALGLTTRRRCRETARCINRG